MKRETIIAAIGIVFSLLVYILLRHEFTSSSPLILVIINVAGFLLSAVSRLAGGVVLSVGGLALVVHPFLFESSYWLIPGGVLLSAAGLIMLIRWWYTEPNGE